MTGRRFVRAGSKDIRIDGGLIRTARLEGDGYEFLRHPEDAIAELRTVRPRVDLFTFTPGLPGASTTYAYHAEPDNVAAVPVSTFDHWWRRQINDKTRNMARRAEKKGVVVREVPFDDVLVQGIWAIYNESPIRQRKPFPHYGKDLETVRREAGTFLDQSTFFAAFLGDRVIGFAKLVSDDDRRQAALMHILSMIAHADKAPTNALIAQAVKSCAEREIPYLIYSKFSYGKKQRDPLSDFKERNGFQRLEFPRYYVPLTATGRIALGLRLHHRLTDHVPEAVLARVRQLRALWYGGRYQMAKEAR